MGGEGEGELTPTWGEVGKEKPYVGWGGEGETLRGVRWGWNEMGFFSLEHDPKIWNECQRYTGCSHLSFCKDVSATLGVLVCFQRSGQFLMSSYVCPGVLFLHGWYCLVRHVSLFLVHLIQVSR